MTDVGLVDSDGNAVNDDDGNQIMAPGGGPLPAKG